MTAASAELAADPAGRDPTVVGRLLADTGSLPQGKL